MMCEDMTHDGREVGAYFDAAIPTQNVRGALAK
jgi:hypothetical protein